MTIEWSQWEGVIRRAAPRYLRRAHAAGAASVQIEDVRSELAIAWCVAREKFDPSHGVPFGAYLNRGMMNHINRWIDAQIAQVGLNLDDDAGDEGDTSIHELIADDAQLQDELLGETQEFERRTARLSPEARQFVTLLAKPPVALYEEMNAIQARAEFAKSRGIATSAPRHITSDLIMNMMGASRSERGRIYKELRKVASKRLV